MNEIECQHCHHKWTMDEPLIGQAVACPSCGKRFRTPDLGVMEELLDFDFSQTVTPKAVKAFYRIAFVCFVLALLALGTYTFVALGYAGSASSMGPLLWYLTVVDLFSVLALFLWLLGVRLGLEFIMTVHRAEKHLREINSHSKNPR